MQTFPLAELTGNLIEYWLKKWEHLHVEEENSGLSLSACVLVIKPNQPISVAIRTLKQIINKENWDNSDEPLTIAKL